MEEQQSPKTMDEMKAESRGGICCPVCKFDGILVVVRTVRLSREVQRVRRCRKCGNEIVCRERYIGLVTKRQLDR